MYDPAELPHSLEFAHHRGLLENATGPEDLLILAKRWAPWDSWWFEDEFQWLFERHPQGSLAFVKALYQNTSIQSTHRWWARLPVIEGHDWDAWLLERLQDFDRDQRIGVTQFLARRQSRPLLTKAAAENPTNLAFRIALQALGRRDSKVQGAPHWWSPTLLFLPTRITGEEVFPSASWELHLQTLAPGLLELEQQFLPGELRAFCSSVVWNWIGAGGSNLHLDILGPTKIFGEDRDVVALSRQVRAWSDGNISSARAAIGVLSAIGSDRALRELDLLANKSARSIRGDAVLAMKRAATERGLNAADLADRLLPDFGLSAQGTLTFPHEGQVLTIGIDEGLQLFVRLEDQPLKAVPRTAESAALAHKELKKQLPALLKELCTRHEQAMKARRRWNRAVFEQNLRHPLLGRFMRGLVWTSLQGEQAVQFRIAEDGSFADVNELPLALGDEVMLAHPGQLEPQMRAKWSSLFADYAIMQPFQQLGRELPTLTAEEAAGETLLRFQNVELSTNRLLQLLKQDWQHRYTHLSRSVLGIGQITIEITPGFFAGMQHNAPQQTVVGIRGNWGKADPLAVGEFILMVEALRAEQ